jgi:PhnB protein
MPGKVRPIPEGYHSVTPFLTVRDAAAVLAFLKGAFDAQETHVMRDAAGAIRHVELRIGDSPVMLGQSSGDWKPMPASLYVYVEDADAVYARALQAGGTTLREPANQYYGDRNAGVTDPSGNSWWIATHVEDVPPAELQRRAQAAFAKT